MDESVRLGIGRTGRGRSVVAETVDARPFGTVLRDLLLDRDITTGMQNPNWMAFSEQVPDVHYETLRKAVSGERAPGVRLMERCAVALGLEPTIFVEYRLWLAQRQFDPREVGYEEAAANLAAWSTAHSKKKR